MDVGIQPEIIHCVVLGNGWVEFANLAGPAAFEVMLHMYHIKVMLVYLIQLGKFMQKNLFTA